MIVDAHAHVFPEVRGRTGSGPVVGLAHGRARLGDREIQLLPPTSVHVSFTPATFLAHLDQAGVDRAVILQGPFYGDWSVYTLAAIQEHPTRLAGLTYLDPWDRGGRAMYDDRIPRGGYLGVKLECSVPTGLGGLHPGARLDDPALAWLWKDLEERRLTLTLDLGQPGTASYQTAAVDKIARAHPGLRIVVAHLGQPSAPVLADKALRKTWAAQVDLARHANVWLDTASLPHHWPEEPYPYVGAAAALAEAAARVGPARLLWGTDAPGLLSTATYPQLRSWVQTALAGFGAPELAGVMGGNAVTAYGLDGG